MRSEKLWGVAWQRIFLEEGIHSLSSIELKLSRFQRLRAAPQANKMPNASMPIRKADLVAVSKGDTSCDLRLAINDSFIADCRLLTADFSQMTNDKRRKPKLLTPHSSLLTCIHGARLP